MRVSHMRRHNLRLEHMVLVAALAVGVVGCSPQDPEVGVNDRVPAAQQVAESTEGGEGGEAAPAADFAAAEAVWVAEGLAFTEAPSTMPADGTVIGLETIGGLPHNVVFEDFEGDRVLVEAPGEGEYAAQVSVPAGDYTFYCSVPGHRATMEGTITVE